MFKVTTEVSFAAAHRLMRHPEACSNLHGHNYRVLLTLQTKDLLQPSEMVVDMKTLKQALSKILEKYDHVTILNLADSSFGDLLAKEGTQVRYLAAEPTAEMMAKCFFEEVAEELLANVRYCNSEISPAALKLTVYETEKNYASYYNNL